MIALFALEDLRISVVAVGNEFGGSAVIDLFFAIYRVDPTTDGTRRCASGIRKEKLASGGGNVFASGNYEGICLGPCLPDGKWSVLLVSDAGDGASPPYILPMSLSFTQP